MKKILAFTAVVLLCIEVLAQETKNEAKKTEADYFWESRPSFWYKTIDQSGREINFNLPAKLSDHKSGTNDLASFKNDTNNKAFDRDKEKEEKYSVGIFNEIHRRYFREWGIHFWKNFPADPRRFEWLLETVSFSPLYLSCVDDMMTAGSWLENYDTVTLDNIAIQKWNHLYTEFYREFTRSPDVSAHNKLLLYFHNLQNEIHNWRKQTSNDQFDYAGWIKRVGIFDFWSKKRFPVVDNNLSAECLSADVSLLLENGRIFGLTEDDLKNCADLLTESGIPAFAKVASEFRNPPIVKLLEKTPLKFNIKSEQGNSVELENFKGKLVYVDFWSLGCSGCIASMPSLKKIYEKYKSYGFEVISACFVEGKRNDGTDWFTNEKERIAHVHEKLCGDWPLVLLEKQPGQKIHPIRTTYGFEGNPNLFLFDENGKLLLCNGELRYNPEAVIRDYLIAKGKIKEK